MGVGPQAQPHPAEKELESDAVSPIHVVPSALPVDVRFRKGTGINARPLLMKLLIDPCIPVNVPIVEVHRL